jgi:hypothetical protein
VRPWPDNQAAAASHARLSGLPDVGEVTQLRRQKGIVPASHEQDGRSERLQSVFAINPHPKGVSIRMPNPILEEGNVCTGSSPVGVKQWESMGCLLDLIR